MSKILWNPYMTEEEYYAHIDEFLEAFYGPGWTYIRKYIDMADNIMYFNKKTQKAKKKSQSLPQN